MRFTAEKVEKPAPTNGIGPEGAPPGKLLYRRRPLYGGGLGLRRTARAGVIQDAADFGVVEGLGEQVVSAQVEGFGPETGIRLPISVVGGGEERREQALYKMRRTSGS